MTGLFILLNLGNQNSTIEKNEAENNKNTTETLIGTDAEGDPLPENQQSTVFTAANQAAKEYFTYSPFESPTARKARLQNYFTKDSSILKDEKLPSFAGPNKTTPTIKESVFSPIAKNQEPDELNVRITVELVERNTANEFVSSETSVWLVLVKGSGTDWKPYNILPVDSPELIPVERNRD